MDCFVFLYIFFLVDPVKYVIWIHTHCGFFLSWCFFLSKFKNTYFNNEAYLH